jgi:putative transposase
MASREKQRSLARFSIDRDTYLHCHRYIELNPVRARMTDDPVAYNWSSAASHCG